MKILPLLSSLFWVGLFYGQLTFSPNPWNVNSGLITINYGPDYSFWNPNGASTIYMYSGLETLNDGNNTWDYHDDWADTSGMVPLTLNTVTGIYTGTIDLATHDYYEEANLSNYGPVPNGITVYEFYFLFRNAAGDSQSPDLYGTDYGFQVSTMSLQDIPLSENSKLQIVEGKLYLNDYNGKVHIYNTQGQSIQSLSVSSTHSPISLSLQKGIYIFQLEDGSSMKAFIE